jgi:hypothetical protein
LGGIGLGFALVTLLLPKCHLQFQWIRGFRSCQYTYKAKKIIASHLYGGSYRTI